MNGSTLYSRALEIQPTSTYCRAKARSPFAAAAGIRYITIDESAGDVLQLSTTLGQNGLAGTIALRAIGTSSADNVVINGSSNSFAFNSSRLNFSSVSSILYSDDGGGDTITTSGPIAITLNLSGGDNVTNYGDVTLVF